MIGGKILDWFYYQDATIMLIQDGNDYDVRAAIIPEYLKEVLKHGTTLFWNKPQIHINGLFNSGDICFRMVDAGIKKPTPQEFYNCKYMSEYEPMNYVAYRQKLKE